MLLLLISKDIAFISLINICILACHNLCVPVRIGKFDRARIAKVSAQDELPEAVISA